MRKNLTPFIALFLALTLFSCASDDSLEEIQSIETADLTATISRSSSPCAKNLLSMVSNSQLNLDCKSDLGGKTINLPKGVKLNFDGGTLKNGTLHFEGGTIDGRLLSKGLKITGDVSLANSTYTFDPNQWGITEGWTSRNNARSNKEAIMEAIKQVQSLGGNTLEIDNMDAYLDIGNIEKNPNWYSAEEGITIPSNFTLRMSDNTHLRVYPNNSPVYALIGLRDVHNAHVQGGHLHGDRDDHDYSGSTTHEWGSLVEIEGSKNSSIKDISMSMASGDGMRIHSLMFTWQPGYTPTTNITVDNCVFNKNRRNNLTITDGRKLVIENSTFIDAGANTNKSKGTQPRMGIDIEANRKRINGKIVYYEKVDGVVIRNNKEYGSSQSGFHVAIGDNVTLEDNEVETSISYRYSNGSIIRNNKLKSNGHNIALRGGEVGSNTISNNKIYGNTVIGYTHGVQVRGRENDVFNNTFINCDEAIFLIDIKDSKISNNTVRSTNEKSKGIFAYRTSIENSEIVDNDITVTGTAFNFIYVNRKGNEKNFKVDIINNTFNSNYFSKILNAHNLKFKDNTINTSLRIIDAKNLVLDHNTIDGSSDIYSHTILFRGKSKDIDICYNKLYANKLKQNTWVESSQSEKEIKEWGNLWNYR